MEIFPACIMLPFHVHQVFFLCQPASCYHVMLTTSFISHPPASSCMTSGPCPCMVSPQPHHLLNHASMRAFFVAGISNFGAAGCGSSVVLA